MSRDLPGTTLRRDVLRALMAERGWTRAELARQTGIGDYHVGRLLDGKTQPGGRTIAQLMRAFPKHRFEDLFCIGRGNCEDAA
jgi:transcriptional regulator with XRE-family HTH domain